MTAIIVNGIATALQPNTTVRDAVASVTTAEAGCAVAVNDEVVPRHDWSQRLLAAGDRVEVLTAVQGG